MTEAAIITHNLTRRFGDLVAVNGLELSLPKSRISGFLGPNGCGKSTTIRMLCGLLTPSDGTVEVLGYELPKEAEPLRRRIGYMTQRFSLYDDLTVMENLRFVADIYSLRGQQGRERIERALADYRLEDIARQRAGTMSGGQRQRLSLAAVTLHDPELLLLDEPTSAVDPQSRRDFWEKLFTLADSGTTILVSTHYMDEAERCHKLIFLNQGRLVAEGAPEKLMEGLHARVLEITCDKPRVALEYLRREHWIFSVSELGNRLHLMTDPQRYDAVDRVRALLEQQKLHGDVEEVGASLEDVFVAATENGADYHVDIAATR